MAPMLQYRDNFGFATPPDKWALDFKQEFSMRLFVLVVEARKDWWSGLRRRATALMKLPGYRDAHGTDDHFMSALFVAGCVGVGGRGDQGRVGAEDWELTNMCNSQFTLGRWEVEFRYELKEQY